MLNVVAIGTYRPCWGTPLRESGNSAVLLAGLRPALGLAMNTGGGLKAKVRPPGATGVAQCVELVQQLRGGAINQVDAARVGLAHNIGGPTAVSTVTILEGPGADGS